MQVAGGDCDAQAVGGMSVRTAVWCSCSMFCAEWRRTAGRLQLHSLDETIDGRACGRCAVNFTPLCSLLGVG
eukprot:275147-Prymnesium_polylepis.1